MTFVINKDNDERIIRKTLGDDVLANVTFSNSLGSSYTNFNLNVPQLQINSVSINNANTLNASIVTPGIASASKLLVLNSDRNITNLNTITCNSITLNNNTII